MLSVIWQYVKKLAISSFIFDVICLIWRQLEIYEYGAVQYRKVDDIIMMIMFPIIYLAVCSFDNK